MTATSGPGFSLMQESIGYAFMTETPCVIVDVQRVGPSTGQAYTVMHAFLRAVYELGHRDLSEFVFCMGLSAPRGFLHRILWRIPSAPFMEEAYQWQPV